MTPSPGSTPARVIDANIQPFDRRGLDLAEVNSSASGCPTYHLPTFLRLFIYGYLNRAASSRRLDREAQRTVELMWPIERLAPDREPSLTDPDAHTIKTRGGGLVGHNVQGAGDNEHHLIVSHEVTGSDRDRHPLTTMARRAREA